MEAGHDSGNNHERNRVQKPLNQQSHDLSPCGGLIRFGDDGRFRAPFAGNLFSALGCSIRIPL
jgi:hypothetical protein